MRSKEFVIEQQQLDEFGGSFMKAMPQGFWAGAKSHLQGQFGNAAAAADFDVGATANKLYRGFADFMYRDAGPNSLQDVEEKKINWWLGKEHIKPLDFTALGTTSTTPGKLSLEDPDNSKKVWTAAARNLIRQEYKSGRPEGSPAFGTPDEDEADAPTSMGDETAKAGKELDRYIRQISTQFRNEVLRTNKNNPNVFNAITQDYLNNWLMKRGLGAVDFAILNIPGGTTANLNNPKQFVKVWTAVAQNKFKKDYGETGGTFDAIKNALAGLSDAEKDALRNLLTPAPAP